MALSVKSVMTKKINTVDRDATIVDAAKVMAADTSHEGYVIILEKGTPVGIITERDIVNKVVVRERNPAQMTVAEIMSSPLITIDPDEDMLTATQMMREHDVRKLVVVRDTIIYGVITARDVAQHASDYVNRVTKDLIRWTSLR
ncbi:MAG: CBS domain-containing protein [Candidatus Bathyarchaeota archaeon]|nr:MAG: CBS domain-containing protein [Candidatus Bathyarchaeota archaeon]